MAVDDQSAPMANDPSPSAIVESRMEAREKAVYDISSSNHVLVPEEDAGKA